MRFLHWGHVSAPPLFFWQDTKPQDSQRYQYVAECFLLQYMHVIDDIANLSYDVGEAVAAPRPEKAPLMSSPAVTSKPPIGTTNVSARLCFFARSRPNRCSTVVPDAEVVVIV